MSKVTRHTAFRNPNNEITSDELSENLYDGGVRVKVEELVWLTRLHESDRRAAEIVPLIKSMLDKASTRPKAAEVADRLLGVCMEPVDPCYAYLVDL
jgi:hypothetical protein